MYQKCSFFCDGQTPGRAHVMPVKIMLYGKDGKGESLGLRLICDKIWDVKIEKREDLGCNFFPFLVVSLGS